MIKSYSFSLRTSKRQEFVEITEDVKKIIEKSDIKKGYCIILTPHTTAGITINQNADFNVQVDMLNIIDRLIPRATFLNVEGNSDSHLKQSLFGNSNGVFIENSSLILGDWQAIFLCEFDGPRARKILIQIQGE